MISEGGNPTDAILLCILAGAFQSGRAVSETFRPVWLQINFYGLSYISIRRMLSIRYVCFLLVIRDDVELHDKLQLYGRPRITSKLQTRKRFRTGNGMLNKIEEVIYYIYPLTPKVTIF